MTKQEKFDKICSLIMAEQNLIIAKAAAEAGLEPNFIKSKYDQRLTPVYLGSFYVFFTEESLDFFLSVLDK